MNNPLKDDNNSQEKFYIANGKKINLLAKKDEIAIVLEDKTSFQTVNKILAENNIDLVDKLDSNKYILETTTEKKINFNQIAALSGVKNVLRVYENTVSNSWMIATDEIIVALNKEIKADKFLGRDRRFTSYRPLLGTSDQFIVTVKDQQQVINIANQLETAPETQWASPNFYQDNTATFTPNDPIYPKEWHLHNTGQYGGTPDADVDAPEAWDINQGGSADIVIAVIDTGMHLNHPDLNIWTNLGEIANNGIDDDGNGWVDDVNGWDFTGSSKGDNNPSTNSTTENHATSVAGVAAARGNNSQGVAGIAYNSRIMPVRILGENASITDANIAQAIYYAAGRKADGTGTWHAADILNNSWVGSPSTSISNAFTWANTNGRNGKGSVIVAATGNNNSSILYPANLSDDISGVMAVGASDNLNTVSSFSNYGPELDFVSLSGGGTTNSAIWTTSRTNTNVAGTYSGFSGTSAAAPLVSGIAALILAEDPNLTAVQVRKLMRNTTDLIGSGYNDNGLSLQYGYGRVNAYTALAGIGIKEIQVFDKTKDITDNTGIVDFNTTVGNNQVKVFRVRNQGTEDLTLGQINLGNGAFSLVSGFSDNILSVGESATFAVRFSPNSLGTVTQNISFTNDDTDESVFNFTLSGTGVNLSNFSNNSAIAINDNNSASPSVSTINVSGLEGKIKSVKVLINNLTHKRATDLDLLLLSPEGQKVMLMSDAGGLNKPNNVNLSFDANATTGLPVSIVSAIYQPTNLGSGDVFAGVDSSLVYPTDLSLFNDSNPNGNWSLYAVDDQVNNLGQIAGGWQLELGTIPINLPSLSVTDSPKVEGTAFPNTSFIIQLSAASNSLVKVDYNTTNGTAIAGSDYTSKSGTIIFNPGEVTKTVNVPILDDNLNELDETFTFDLNNAINAQLIDNQAVGIITDTLKAQVTTTLATNIENLQLTAMAAINGTGNANANIITGNGAINILDGQQGNDTLIGGASNDVLVGGEGFDRFAFKTGQVFSSGSLGIDTISDFNSGDAIALSKTTFTAIQSNIGLGFSLPTEFTTVTSDVLAASSNAVIVYNSANGKLFYNQNLTTTGFGSGGQFAIVNSAIALSANDLEIIA